MQTLAGNAIVNSESAAVNFIVLAMAIVALLVATTDFCKITGHMLLQAAYKNSAKGKVLYYASG